MMSRSARADEPLLVAQRAYDLVKDLVPAIRGFSRDHRFTLGERLEGTLLDLLLDLRQLKFVRDREVLLGTIDERLDRARVLVRLACDWRQLSEGRYGQAVEALSEIGRMVGGLARRGAAPPAVAGGA